MSSVVISGDTSGSVVVAAPAVAGTNTLTLQAATATNAVNTLGTAVASTSGTSIDFTGLPAWVKKITVMYHGVSMTGANNWLIQLGTSAGLQITGYVGQGLYINPAITATSLGAGFNVANQQAATFHGGMLVLSLVDTNKWSAMGTFSNTNSASLTSGYVSLSGTLDRVRVTTTTAVDTFDAGTINILYEG